MVVKYLYFFFLSYADHRDLHILTYSFPTRRSSDLILSIGCKCFIQREVGPGFTSDHITEPVMEQFMRYDIFMGLIQVLPISHVHLIKEYGGSGVFHRSGAKIPHDALGVLEIGRASCRERVCKYV